jgi:hypothetical protein
MRLLAGMEDEVGSGSKVDSGRADQAGAPFSGWARGVLGLVANGFEPLPPDFEEPWLLVRSAAAGAIAAAVPNSPKLCLCPE